MFYQESKFAAGYIGKLLSPLAMPRKAINIPDQWIKTAWLKGEKPAAARKQLPLLAELSKRLLRRFYTDRTVDEEQQTRFNSLADYYRS